MSDHPFYCPEQTYRGNRFEPPEFCETEVENPGDLCPVHEEDDRSDEAHDDYLESLRKE